MGKVSKKGMVAYDGVHIWGGTCVIWRTNERRLVGNGAQTCGVSCVKLVRNRGMGEVVVASRALHFVVLCRGGGYASLFVRVGWGSEAHGSGANALPLRCKHRERNRTNKRRKERK